MRIVLDLQCCQTHAQDRGMGRYALALTKELVRRGEAHEFFYLLNGRLLSESGPLLRELSALPGRTVLFEGPTLCVDRASRATRELAANLLRNDRIETLSPDVYHVWSVFEGDSIFGDAVPWLELPALPIVNSVTAYDLIPALYPDEYLRQPALRSWFNRTLAVAGHFDLQLAISDATKRDVERLMRLDPARVINISGDVDPYFKALGPDERRRGAVWSRVGEMPFLLYVGGPDFRKNIFGAVEGFAAIATALPVRYNLVLVLSLDGETTRRLETLAAELGIADRLVVTGYVGNDELRELYNACALFVFPSIYEGLGMPVIEAMRCGAPVVVGDNSSLVEIVPDATYRFEATSSEAIGAAMARALCDPSALARMRAYSAERAASFSWTSSAETTLRAWADAVARKTAERPAARHDGRKPRIAMFTPLPQEKTGIADYAADFVPALSRQADIELFVDDMLTIDPTSVAVPVRHHSDFANRHARFDAIVYQLGNSPYHHYMLPYMRRHLGVSVLHDAYIGHLGHDTDDSLAFVRAIIEEEGGAARAVVEEIADPFTAARALIEAFPCAGAIVDRSLGVIVHSDFARDTLRAVANACAGPEIVVMQQYRAGIPPERRLDKAQARRRLGLDDSREIVATFGHVASTKGILELIEAFLTSNAGRRGAMLALVGELEGGPAAATPYAQAVLAAIDGRSDIRITGFVDQEIYDLWLCALDVGVQLRTVSKGETSGAMLNHLMNAKPFIYSRLGAAAEFPPTVALGLDDHDPDTVRTALNALLDDGAARETFSRAAKAYAREVLDADVIAAKFVATAVAMAQRARSCGPSALARKIAEAVSADATAGPLSEEIAAGYVRQERSEAPPRLLVEVGDAAALGGATSALLHAAFRLPDRTVRPRAFSLASGTTMLADAEARACGAMVPFEAVQSGPLVLRPFDRVLVANETLRLGAALRPLALELRALGGTLVAVIENLDPIEHAERHPSRAADLAKETLAILLEHADGLICTSRRDARRLETIVAAGALAIRRGLRVALAPRPRPPAVAREPAAGAAVAPPFFLLATPMQPDEGHALVLEAFEQHWREGGTASLCVLRGAGWDLRETVDGYAAHRETGQRLHVRAAGEDADWLMAGAVATIVAADTIASRDALEDALSADVPILHADLAALSEIVGDGQGRSFASGDAPALAQAIATMAQSERPPARPEAAAVSDPVAEWTSRVLRLARGSGWDA